MALSVLPAAILRGARYYAPDSISTMLTEIAASPELVLVIDIDALEHSALARVDRVMLLAFGELSRSGARLVLAARHEQERARSVQRSLAVPPLLVDACGTALVTARAHMPDARLLVLSDNPLMLAGLTSTDRALALGRPELAGPGVLPIGDKSVRAALWFLSQARAKAA
jgi:hypothetical protein